MIRKVREAMTAVQIEQYYTKREILELYLNQCTSAPASTAWRRRASVISASTFRS